MAATSLATHGRPTAAGLAALLGDLVRSPLGQALALTALIGTLLFNLAPSLGLRDTFRGAALGFRQAPAFDLVDQFDKPVSLAGLAGGPVVLTFIYTNCPDSCPLTVSKVADAMNLLGADTRGVHYVAITVDPERDNPAVLRAYADRFKLRDRWSFLTGPTNQVGQVVKAYHAEPIAAEAAQAGAHERGEHAAIPTPKTDELYHPSVVLLVDGEGALRFAYGPDFEPEDLVHDITLMQADLGGPTVPFALE